MKKNKTISIDKNLDELMDEKAINKSKLVNNLLKKHIEKKNKKK